MYFFLYWTNMELLLHHIQIKCFRSDYRLQLAFDSLPLIRLYPLLDVSTVPRKPGTLCSDSIQALRKALIKPFCTLRIEKLLDSYYISFLGEARCADGHNRPKHRKTGWEFRLQFIEVLSQPSVQGFDTLRMGSQCTNWKVDILLFDFASKRKT